MAVIVKTIGSGAGRDFSTLAGWAASIPANLVTDGNSYEGHCYNDSEFVGTGGGSILTLTGHTTDASHTITLTTGPGQSFRDNANVQTNALRYNAANGVAITSDAGGDAGTINIGDSNVFLANLQVKNTGYHGNGIACGETDPQIEDCIVAGDARGALYNTDHNQTVRNCLLYVLEPSAQIIQGGHGIANLYFCTIVAPSDVGAPPTKAFNTGYGTASVAENCAIFGCAALDSPASITYTTCMTDLSSGLPSGVTGSKTYADQFQNITTTSADWREKPGAALRGAGTADATNGATDIATTARPQGGNWDIGCWQSIVAGDTTLTIDVQATVEFSLALSGDANSPVEALAADRRDVQNPLEMGLVTVNDGACPFGFEGGVASGLAGNVEWSSLGFADRNIVSEWLSQPSIDGSFVGEWLKLSLLDTPAPGEFATSLIGVPPLTIEFQGQTQLTADGVLPIEWSALPAIMRVSLERLLSSPSKRRILGTSGRLRLLKRQ
jgi:hypothetical protein